MDYKNLTLNKNLIKNAEFSVYSRATAVYNYTDLITVNPIEDGIMYTADTAGVEVGSVVKLTSGPLSGNLYEVIDESKITQSRYEKAENFSNLLFERFKQVGIPDNIIDSGFTPEDVDNFVAETMELKGALDQNPVSFYENEIKKLLTTLSRKSNEWLL